MSATPTRPWQRAVAMFLGGQTVSLFGSALVQYAIMWHLTITTRSGSVLMLSIVFGMLPQAIVSIFGGVWADRYNRKVLIIAADGTIAATTLALALTFLAGYQAHWLIYLTLTIRSIGAGIQSPAVSALLPQITPAQHLMRVNGLNGSIQSAMALLAPAVAAALYAQFGLVSVFFVDTVTAAIGIGILLLLPVATVRSAREAGAGYFADLIGGMRYVATHRTVRRVLILYAAIFFMAVPPSYLTPLMVVRTFGTGAGLASEAQEVAMLTGLEIAWSAGMLVGGAVLAAWGGLKNRLTMIGIATIAMSLFGVGMGLSQVYWVFAAFGALIGFAVAFFSTPSYTLLQETTEPQVQGRVFGFVGIVTALAMPLGMVVFGPLADVVSVQVLLIAAGIAVVPCGIAALVIGVRDRPAVSASAAGPETSFGAKPGESRE